MFVGCNVQNPFCGEKDNIVALIAFDLVKVSLPTAAVWYHEVYFRKKYECLV
jgi:hypothetical protein